MVAELVLVLILIFGMSEIGKLKWILKESKLPWLKLDIEFPYEEMLEEAKAYKDRFVKHRAEDQIHGYRHKGWSSLCIHGIRANFTNHYTTYGFDSKIESFRF